MWGRSRASVVPWPWLHTCSIYSFVGPFFSFPSFFIFHFSNILSSSAFASFSRGQPPARQTKVVDYGLSPVKTGSTHLCVPVCVNDTVFSKPTSVGRNVVDDQAQTNNISCVVCVCGSVRCKTCKHVSQGSTFMSNVTRKCYNVVSPSCYVNCATDNVVYLISCKKCGVQYVGETGQTLRKRLNNHRNRLRSLTNLYLYHHFNSDGHSEEDIAIEEITTSDKDTCSLSAKRLERGTTGVESFAPFTLMG